MRRLVFLDYPADESRIEWQLEDEVKKKFAIENEEAVLPRAPADSYSLISGKKTVGHLIEMLRNHRLPSDRLTALFNLLP